MLWPTVRRPVRLGTKHPFGAYDQILIIVWQLRVCWFGAPSLTRERVCRLQLLLVPARAIIFGSEARRIRGHILLSRLKFEKLLLILTKSVFTYRKKYKYLTGRISEVIMDGGTRLNHFTDIEGRKIQIQLINRQQAVGKECPDNVRSLYIVCNNNPEICLCTRAKWFSEVSPHETACSK
jgi:hypothetical protein